MTSSRDSSINVLHVVGGRLSGGAARGTRVLSDALRELNVNSHILCAEPIASNISDATSSVALGPWMYAKHRLRSIRDKLPLIRYHTDATSLFSPGVAGINLQQHSAYRTADIVHLHWMNRGMLSVEGIGSIDKPIIWTMRDMWPFSGGCHYTMDCSNFKHSCGSCPQLLSSDPRDLSHRILERKRTSFPADVTYVGISSWISDVAASSAVLRDRDIRTISNCIDTSVFYPVPRKEARARLGLPESAKIVLQGALSQDDQYKGHSLWREAQSHLRQSDLIVCSFGAAQGETGADFDFGLVRDDTKLRDIYAASDVLVFPSIQEAFGKVPAEAMACGTPVVAFGATGPKDIVTDRVTGYAARPFDPADLAAGIIWCVEDNERLDQLSRAAERDAQARFNPNVAAKAYIDLYREKVSG